MAKPRKRGTGKWQASVRVAGTPSKYKTFDTRAKAEAWQTEERKKIKASNHGSAYGLRVSDLIDRYKKEVTPNKKSALWESNTLKRFLQRPIVNLLLTDITRLDVQKMLDDRVKKTSASTALREHNIWSAMFNYAIQHWGWMDINPCANIKKPKTPPGRDIRITQKDVNAICDALGYDDHQPITTQRQQLAVAFLLAIETAMRKSEIWQTNWQNVHIEERRIFLPDTKTNQPRNVPLSKKAIELLKKMTPKHEGKVFTANKLSCEKFFQSAVQAIGRPELHFHDSRHEAASRMAKKMPMHSLMKITGHTNPKTLQIYYNPTPAEMAALLD